MSPYKSNSLFTTDYRPVIEISQELYPKDASYFKSLIDILRCIVELRRIDIAVDVSMLSSIMSFSRKGHLSQAFHVFGYLKLRYNSEMLFDLSVLDFDDNQLTQQDRRHTPYDRDK